MINSFQMHQVETEHREQQENGFQRENHAWSPIAQDAYSREGHALFKEHCRGGHRGHHNPGTQFLPDIQLSGQGEPMNPNPMAGPQGNSCQQQDVTSPASTAVEIAKLDKTIMDFTRLLRGMGGAHDSSAGAGAGAEAESGAGNDTATAGDHNLTSNANASNDARTTAGADQSTTPAQKISQQATDTTSQTPEAAETTSVDATTPTASSNDGSDGSNDSSSVAA